MDISELENIKNEAEIAINQAQKTADLDLIWKNFLDKDGRLGVFFRSMASLTQDERVAAGIKANEIKQAITALYRQKAAAIKSQKQAASQNRAVDVTLPGVVPQIGHLHPFTLIERQVASIFHGMGFEIITSPEAENEWYNFDSLNIPKDAPARDVFDSLFLNDGSILRPHTSPGQVRYMECHPPPLRIIAPGRVFRRDAVDASHMPNFYQIEGLMVDKNISAANFKAIIDKFFKQFFCDSKAEAQKGAARSAARRENIRLRPSYFPFTEPSFEVDLKCVNCAGSGCPVCKNGGWMEIMGAGMVHPNVLKNAGVDPDLWQGFAFGIGMDRLAMIKYKINDIRLFYGGDQRFLNQF